MLKSVLSTIVLSGDNVSGFVSVCVSYDTKMTNCILV